MPTSRSDFTADYIAGGINCVSCGNTADVVEEFDLEQAVFILEAMLEKEDLAADAFVLHEFRATKHPGKSYS